LARFLFHWIVSVAHGRKQLLESAYGQGKPGLNLSASPQGQDSEPGLNRSDAVTNLLGGTLVLSSATV
jgi:hypothetical protein